MLQKIHVNYEDPLVWRLDREDNPYPAIVKSLKEEYGLDAGAYFIGSALASGAPAIPVIGMKGDLSTIDKGLDFLIEKMGWPQRVMKPPLKIISTETFTTKEAYKLLKEKCAKNQIEFKKNTGDPFALIGN